MSRKYIDDHVEFRPNSISSLPSQTNQYYDPGHMFLDPVSGKRFVNEAADDRNGALFVNDQFNARILYEPFDLLPAIAADLAVGYNTNLMLSGTNAVTSVATFAANADGVLLTTTTAKSDQAIIGGATGSQWIKTFEPANQLVFEADIKTGAAINNEIVWAGLKLTSTGVIATDNDQTYFRYQDTVDGYWHMVDSTAGTDNDVATQVAVAENTAYLLQIKIGVDLAPRYYINGVLVGTGLPLTGTALFKPFFGLQVNTTTAAAVTCLIRNVRLVVPRTPVVV